MVADGLSLPEPSNKGTAYLVYGTEGVGKTSLGAYAEGSAILLSRGETGYLTLFNRGRAPKRPYVVVESWSDLLGFVELIVKDSGKYKILVLDAIGGFDRLCQEHVCATAFGGKWGNDGFASYGKGFDRSAGEWLELLSRLEDVQKAGLDVLLLGHAMVTTFDNPLDENYSRFSCDCPKKTWGLSHKWADAVLFLNFNHILQDKGGKKKGVGTDQRVIRARHSDAYDAKNRLGMPPSFDMPDDPKTMWEHLQKQIGVVPC